MPELPEVETTRRGLLPLVGNVVKSDPIPLQNIFQSEYVILIYL